jgi:hypothetical protein
VVSQIRSNVNKDTLHGYWKSLYFSPSTHSQTASVESATDAPEACTNEQETGAPVRAEALETENVVGNTVGTANTALSDPNVAAVADQLQAAALSSSPGAGLAVVPAEAPAEATQGASTSTTLTKEDFLEAMQALMASLGSVVGTASHVRSKPHDLRLSDVKLSEFSGNDDADANSIHPDYFLSLLGWINVHECRTILSFSGLSARDQIVVLVNSLRGERSFMHTSPTRSPPGQSQTSQESWSH